MQQAIRILGVPMDLGQNRRGVDTGPSAVRYANLKSRLEQLGHTVHDEGNVSVPNPEEHVAKGTGRRLRAITSVCQEVYDKACPWIESGDFAVFLGGDHSISIGSISAAASKGPIGVIWVDAHSDFNTPETTRSGSLGGMPVAVATGRALHVLRLDAHLNPPLDDRRVVMGGVRLTDPLEQQLLDDSRIQQVSVGDLRTASPAVFAQLDRLSRISDKLYIHIDMDVLDPVEVSGHQNKVPDGPSSAQLASLFEEIFRRYPKASAIGFATIPATDEGGLSLAAVNRMIAGAIKGLRARR